jgi:hypothetical protein
MHILQDHCGELRLVAAERMACKDEIGSISELTEQINCKLHGLIGNFRACHAVDYVGVRLLVSRIVKVSATERHNNIARLVPPDFWMYVGEVRQVNVIANRQALQSLGQRSVWIVSVSGDSRKKRHPYLRSPRRNIVGSHGALPLFAALTRLIRIYPIYP